MKNDDKKGQKDKNILNFGFFVILMLSSHVCLLTMKTLGNTDSETFGMIGVFDDEKDLVNVTQLKADPIYVEGGISYEFDDNITDSDVYDDISRNIENFDGLTNITACSCCICSSFQVSENIWYKVEVVLDLRYLVFCILGASVTVFIFVAVKKLSHARKQLRLWRLTGRTDLRYVNRRNANVKVQCVNERGWILKLNDFDCEKKKTKIGHNFACLKMGMFLLAEIENGRYFACQTEKWA